MLDSLEKKLNKMYLLLSSIILFITLMLVLVTYGTDRSTFMTELQAQDVRITKLENEMANFTQKMDTLKDITNETNINVKAIAKKIDVTYERRPQ